MAINLCLPRDITELQSSCDWTWSFSQVSQQGEWQRWSINLESYDLSPSRISWCIEWNDSWRTTSWSDLIDQTFFIFGSNLLEWKVRLFDNLHRLSKQKWFCGLKCQKQESQIKSFLTFHNVTESSQLNDNSNTFSFTSFSLCRKLLAESFLLWSRKCSHKFSWHLNKTKTISESKTSESDDETKIILQLLSSFQGKFTCL